MKYKLIPHHGEIIVVDTENEKVSSYHGDWGNFVIDSKTPAWRVTNPLSDLLRLQRASEINKMAKENNPYDKEAKVEPFFHAGLCTGAILWGDRSPFTAEDMIGFAEWVSKNKWKYREQYNRFFNDDGDVLHKDDLLQTYLTETAFSRVKESEVEIELKFIMPTGSAILAGESKKEVPLLTDGAVTVVNII